MNGTDDECKGNEEGGERRRYIKSLKERCKNWMTVIECKDNVTKCHSTPSSRPVSPLSLTSSSDAPSDEEGALGSTSSRRKHLRWAQEASRHNRKPIFQYMRQRSLEVTSYLFTGASIILLPVVTGFKSTCSHPQHPVGVPPPLLWFTPSEWGLASLLFPASVLQILGSTPSPGSWAVINN